MDNNNALTVRQLKEKAKMTAREFADFFEMPKRTVEAWQSGRNKPPEYLVKLMEYKLKTEKII